MRHTALKSLVALAIAAIALLAAGCDTIDNKVTPAYRVYINLSGQGVWNTYGVSGVGDYRVFNRSKRLPSNYSYTATTYTGYGGVLLIMALDSGIGTYAPQAFDMSCPVENDADVTVSIDSDTFEAVCSRCGSRYNVLTGMGGPTSGQASTQKVGLRSYKATASASGGYIITN